MPPDSLDKIVSLEYNMICEVGVRLDLTEAPHFPPEPLPTLTGHGG